MEDFEKLDPQKRVLQHSKPIVIKSICQNTLAKRLKILI